MEASDNGWLLKEDDKEVVPDNEEYIQRINEYSYIHFITSIYLYTKARIRRKNEEKSTTKN